MQFNAEPLDDIDLQLQTKPQSLAFGRRLYVGEIDQQRYWLKAQTQNGNPVFKQGFERELNFYQTYATKTSFLLPGLISQVTHLVNPEIEKDSWFDEVLILPDSTALFDVPAIELGLSSITQRLLRAIDAVEELIKLGFLHADLKAEHFRTIANQVYLIDFEQVTPLDDQSTVLNATPRYMAPELFHGETKTVQSEIYALGIIFYEWLSGQRLQATSYKEWAYLHCQNLQVMPPSHFQGYQKLLSGMLAKHKNARFNDFESVKACLITEIE